MSTTQKQEQAKPIKAFYRVGEFKQEVLDEREKILSRGFDIGFESAKPYINLKKGYTSYLYSFPFSGKTAFIFDTYMYIAKKYGIKIGIYSPEAGGKNALVAYLVQVYLGKKLHGIGAQKATDKEWEEALIFIDSHFVLLDPKLIGKDKIEFSATEMFNQIYMAQKEYDWKIDLLCCDPYNMLSKTAEERKKTIADFSLENLTYINHVAREMDMHIQIAMHLAGDDHMKEDKETGIEYYRKPQASRTANGQSVHRVMQIGMGIWRCPEGVIETSTGLPYPANATDYFVQKNKVQGAGSVGTWRLFYDEVRQKFYEVIGGVKYFCGEFEEKGLKKETSKPLDTITPVDFSKLSESPF